VEGAGWDYGTNLAYLKELMAYWQHDFDWRKQEAKLNGFAQFRAQIDGVGIHFVHVRGKGPNPLQLLLLHGWHNTNATYPDLTPAEQQYLAASQGWAFQEGPMSLSKPPNRRPWPSG
jgi:epoxide hydrolase-like protein